MDTLFTHVCNSVTSVPPEETLVEMQDRKFTWEGNNKTGVVFYSPSRELPACPCSNDHTILGFLESRHEQESCFMDLDCSSHDESCEHDEEDDEEDEEESAHDDTAMRKRPLAVRTPPESPREQPATCTSEERHKQRKLASTP